MRARLWYARIKSCNNDSGFGANIGSERSRNSLQLGKNVQVEEASVWNFFRRNNVLASKGSATVIKRKKVPSQKFLPAYHEAYPCSVPLSWRKGSELVLCTICKSDLHGGQFDCKQPVESKFYKEFKATGKVFFQLRVCLFLPFPALIPLSRFNAANIEFFRTYKHR